MKIHLNSRQGMYTVTSYNDTFIWLVTKKLPEFTVPCSDFKSFAGGSNNADMTGPEADRFLATVNPSMYKHQAEMTEKVMEAVKALSTQSVCDDENEDFDKSTAKQYENWFYQKSNELARFQDKIRKTASEVYKQKLLDFSNLQIEKGIKFIIQTNSDVTEFRFCFDPYEFVPNSHSAISDVYRQIGWNTINGGWIKIINNNVVLYGQSGDYGVYKDSIAIKAASKLFPNHKIFSYAGKEWFNELSDKYDDLPF